MNNAEIFEEHRFTVRREEPLGTQLLRIIPQVQALLDGPGRAQVREIVIVLERPVALTRGKR